MLTMNIIQLIHEKIFILINEIQKKRRFIINQFKNDNHNVILKNSTEKDSNV